MRINHKIRKRCATGCGKYLLHYSANFCTACGIIYRIKIRRKKYKYMDINVLFSIIRQEVTKNRK